MRRRLLGPECSDALDRLSKIVPRGQSHTRRLATTACQSLNVSRGSGGGAIMPPGRYRQPSARSSSLRTPVKAGAASDVIAGVSLGPMGTKATMVATATGADLLRRHRRLQNPASDRTAENECPQRRQVSSWRPNMQRLYKMAR